jgi:hypothetical protein
VPAGVRVEDVTVATFPEVEIVMLPAAGLTESPNVFMPVP